MGRRVRKEVFTYDNGWPANPDKREHFVYDGWTLDTPRLAGRDRLQGRPRAWPVAASQGWNVVMVLDGLNSNAVVRKLTWGLDLSGTIHGSGGIGGLLAAFVPGGEDDIRLWYFYDGEPLTRRATRSVGAAGPRAKPARRVKGNGNLTQVLDATATNNISIAAHYEYDPYGNVIHSNGPYADANPFRFSTKWFDEETDLGYWGYRFYSPPLGRWISRDPSEEKEGGLNLCAFVKNSPIDRWDFLGLWGERDHYAAVKEAAVKAGLCNECATKMAEGAYGQDLWHQLDLPRHFMTDAWDKPDGGRAQKAYLDWELEQVNTHLRKAHCLRALYSYGKILHTYQDNFAHIDGVVRPGNTGVVWYNGRLVGHYAATLNHHMSGPNAWFNAKRPDSTALFGADWAAAKSMTDEAVYASREMFFGCPCKCDDPKAKRGL